MLSNWRAIAGASGVVFVIVFVLGLVIQGDPPTFADDGEQIAAWFADNSTAYLAGDVVIGVGFILFYFPFLAGLFLALRFAEGGSAMWSLVALIGGIAFPLASGIGGVFLMGLALVEGQASADMARFASAAAYHGVGVAFGLTAILLGGASVVILRTRVFWLPLGWLGAVLGVAAILGSAGVIQKDPEGALSILGFLAFVGFVFWILALSVALLQSRSLSETP